MEVGPHDECGEHEQGATTHAAASCVDEEPEHSGEERQRGRLGADRPAPRACEDGEQADDERRSRRRSARPGRGRCEPEREHHEQHVEDDDGPQAGELVGAVEHDLREPLLIRPRRALAEHRECLRPREAVVDDLATRHEREPRVADDERGSEHGEQHDPDERDQQDGERAGLERASGSTGGALRHVDGRVDVLRHRLDLAHDGNGAWRGGRHRGRHGGEVRGRSPQTDPGFAHSPGVPCIIGSERRSWSKRTARKLRDRCRGLVSPALSILRG